MKVERYIDADLFWQHLAGLHYAQFAVYTVEMEFAEITLARKNDIHRCMKAFASKMKSEGLREVHHSYILRRGRELTAALWKAENTQ